MVDYKKLIYDKIYEVKIKFGFGSEPREEQIVLLKYVNEDDLCWRTADDNSEFNEKNWDVIEIIGEE